MSEGLFPVAQFQTMRTPFYYYDTVLLDQTLQAIKAQTDLHEGYHLHYAVKACANPKVLRHIVAAGFGADCVSGNEVLHAYECGFPADKIVYAPIYMVMFLEKSNVAPLYIKRTFPDYK